MDGITMVPILSVIVPVYNVEGYLGRCVESLRGQTLKEIEIILVDDGSTDSSGELCDELALKDARIKVIHKKNEGQGIARNCGIEAAEGRYVAFVDSDDYMEVVAYAQMIEYMEREQAELGCFGYEHLVFSGADSFSEGKRISCPSIQKRVYRKEAVRREFLLHYFGDDPDADDLRGVSACMSVFRSDIIKEYAIRFLSERMVFSEDTIFSLDYCQYVNCVAVSDKVLYHYCLKPDSFTKGYRKDKWEKVCYFSRVLVQYAKKYELQGMVEHRIQNMLWINLIAAIKQETGGLGIKSYLEVRQKIEILCKDWERIWLTEDFKEKKLSRKQRMFYECIRKKWYGGVWLFSYLRNRRGL